MFKKTIAMILVCISMLGTFAGCGSESNSKNKKDDTSSVSEEIAETTEKETESRTEPETEPEIEIPTIATEVAYIANRETFYDDETENYVVLFSLLDQNENPISVDGTAVITITDDESNVLYDEGYNFTASDYTSWTNRFRDDNTYGYWLEIPKTQLSEAVSSTGTLTLTVFGDNYSFDSDVFDVTDLPQKQGQIIMPEFPASFTDLRYSSHTSYCTINEMTYETEISYDGTMHVTFNAVITLDSKSGEENVSDSCAIGYKVYDSEGFVVDSSTIYTDAISVGEKCKADFILWDLDPTETYTLELINAS